MGPKFTGAFFGTLILIFNTFKLWFDSINSRGQVSGTDLDEVMVSTGNGGVTGFGQHVLVILGVYEHAEPQIALVHLSGRVLPLTVVFILLHSQNGLHVHPLHLNTNREVHSTFTRYQIMFNRESKFNRLGKISQMIILNEENELRNDENVTHLKFCI